MEKEKLTPLVLTLGLIIYGCTASAGQNDKIDSDRTFTVHLYSPIIGDEDRGSIYGSGYSGPYLAPGGDTEVPPDPTPSYPSINQVDVMPLLANSSTVSEITERVKQSIAVNTGSVDEHFTWSYRLLSPNWAKVWSDDGTYPAPYGSGTLKHAWINVGRPTGGGYSSPEDFDYDQPNILPGIFAKFAERKIVLHLILDDPPEGTMKDIEDAMDRYGKTLGWETIDLTDGKGSDLYERIAQNIQRPASMVRLVAKLTDN